MEHDENMFKNKELISIPGVPINMDYLLRCYYFFETEKNVTDQSLIIFNSVLPKIILY